MLWEKQEEVRMMLERSRGGDDAFRGKQQEVMLGRNSRGGGSSYMEPLHL